MSLPLAALVLGELVLRGFGWGGYPAWIREAGKLPSGAAVCMVEPAAAKPYFFANPNRPGYAEQSNFEMPKRPETLRVFLIGESAAKGYPQPRNLSMGSFLREMLAAVHPEKTIEVVNLGTTAVASFPLVYQVREALRFSPDLFVVYAGNNEFFGAYGTGSINASGTLPPAAMRILRGLRGLALVQALDALVHRRSDENRSLMEQMIGRISIAADSPLRAAAARNLGENLTTMLREIRAAGVPAIACTTASNESGMAPVGRDTQVDSEEFRKLVAESASAMAAYPGQAVEALRKAVSIAPPHAKAHFLLGKALAASGDKAAAREAFLKARDLDTMPWRPVSGTEEAIRESARKVGFPLCDIARVFREADASGATGWGLMDDHVHLSLAGQQKAAQAMLEAMRELPAPLKPEDAALARISCGEALEKKLGQNFYDDYRVNHTLRVLFGIPFMRESNPEAYERFAASVARAESQMSPAVLETARQWQTMTPHAGALRPLTGMVARIALREGRPREALELYEIASRQVPDYTSWHLEYLYFTLACRERLNGRLDETDRAEALGAIGQARFLLAHGFSGSGLTERYTGRLHQLRGEWEESIPFLLAARALLGAEDLVASDQALVLSYVKTNRKPEALALVDEGIQKSGRFSAIYRALRARLEEGSIR
jgi:tetratricopeptide (TPR) repeat protein/lysophospholipase L1-like esterase